MVVIVGENVTVMKCRPICSQHVELLSVDEKQKQGGVSLREAEEPLFGREELGGDRHQEVCTD